MSTGWTTKTTWRCRYGHCHRNLFGKPTQPASRVVHNTCEGGGAGEQAGASTGWGSMTRTTWRCK
jgi:hypothetical protein